MLSTIYIYDVPWHVGHIQFTDSSPACPCCVYTELRIEFYEYGRAHARRDPAAQRRAPQHA